ncbi:hypothetical protein [Thiolinea disciformis]|uniref:hypothetical protein n=1 Tax=Thiolinea disciformis TaxID=125614 RepID=UPI00037614EA|nr:hypothetical protein [Thiolinea disciformis]
MPETLEPAAGLSTAATNLAKMTAQEMLWVQDLAANFTQNQSQDLIHNKILHKLVFGKYGVNAVHATDPKQRAYQVMRGNTPEGALNSPLYIIRNAQQMSTLIHQLKPPALSIQQAYPKLVTVSKRMAESFFIRDYTQIYSVGGITIENLLIQDDTNNSPFALDFNTWVIAVNEVLKQKSFARRVFNYENMAHRDGIQLIPERQNNVDVLAGVMMRQVSISRNIIASPVALQGIFASDGAFKDLRITGNHLRVGGAHTIHISGMLSGEVSNNTDLNGIPLAADKIKLTPLRLGGASNIYVLGFKNKPNLPTAGASYYQYEAIKGLDPRSDLRRTKTSSAKNASYYTDVDMMELHRLVRRDDQLKRATSWLSLMEELINLKAAVRVP